MFSKNEQTPVRSSTLLPPSPRPVSSPVFDNDNNKPIKRSSSAEDLRVKKSSDEASGALEEAEQENHSYYFRRYEILIEFANLRNPTICPSGVYVMPAADNLNIWYGVIFIHKGYYKDAVLKFRIDIPSSYPALAPQITFITNTFHPLVDQSGRFAIEAKFSNWTAHRHHIVDILRFIKNSFKVAVLDSLSEEMCLNKKAFRMYHKELHLFTFLSEQSAKVSYADSVVFDDYPEGNPIRFKPLSDNKYEELYSNIVGPSAVAANKESKSLSSLDGVLSIIKKKVSNNITRLFE